MQEIKITILNKDNIGDLSMAQMKSISEIVTALVTSGGLTGVKGGKTIIHFDADGNFMGVELDYWPWRRRKQ